MPVGTKTPNAATVKLEANHTLLRTLIHNSLDRYREIERTTGSPMKSDPTNQMASGGGTIPSHHEPYFNNEGTSPRIIRRKITRKSMQIGNEIITSIITELEQEVTINGQRITEFIYTTEESSEQANFPINIQSPTGNIRQDVEVNVNMVQNDNDISSEMTGNDVIGEQRNNNDAKHSVRSDSARRKCSRKSSISSDIKKRYTCRYLTDDGKRCGRQPIKGGFCTLHGEGRPICEFADCKKRYVKIDEGRYRCRQHCIYSKRCYMVGCKKFQIIGNRFCLIHQNKTIAWKI